MKSKKRYSPKKPKKWDSSAYLRDVLTGKFMSPGNSKVKKAKKKKEEINEKNFKTKVNKLKRKSKLKTNLYKNKS